MRFLAFLFLIGCAQSQLKYKYSGAKRYLASLTREDIEVGKVEGEIKGPLIFASGMDSTYLFVKLFDKEGNLLTDVDPNDLTLSTSEDIEAKPFVLKQGVYKAQILPRVKSKSIRMRVDWLEKVVSHEIILSTTVTPLKNELESVQHDSQQSFVVGEINAMRTNHVDEMGTEGFSIENLGQNRIVDTKRAPASQRYFNFDYLEQARQNLALQVDDAPNSTISQTMHSLFMFFPRKQIFTVEQLTGTIDVTLPTGEKIIFQKESKEITDGVFSEGPVDLNRKPNKRVYPQLKYHGRGVVLRANARGQSPQLGQFDKTKIDMEYGITGAEDVLIINGTTGERCRRPKSDFWEPIDVSPIEFKFPTDEAFDQYLQENCGFSLPKL